MQLPTVTSYGRYKSDNYGINALCFTLPDLDVYFSYKTVVAVRYKNELLVSENIYSNTTGKHLSCIDGGSKATRLPRSEFETRVNAILSDLRINARV